MIYLSGTILPELPDPAQHRQRAPDRGLVIAENVGCCCEQRAGYTKPPKSSCIGCPYRDNKGWRAMRDNRPEEWADAVELDRQIRRRPGMRNYDQFMHRSLKPLDQVDLSTAEDRGQLNLFNNECEGMCGV